MIENCSGAIDIERRPKLLRHAGKIDIFAVKLAITIMKRMHVNVSLISGCARISAGERVYAIAPC